MLVQLPLEPKLLLATESGKCYSKEFPDSITGKKFQELAEKITAEASKKMEID